METPSRSCKYIYICIYIYIYIHIYIYIYIYIYIICPSAGVTKRPWLLANLYTQIRNTEMKSLNCLKLVSQKNENRSQKLCCNCLFFDFIFHLCFASVCLRDDNALQLLSVRIHLRIPIDII